MQAQNVYQQAPSYQSQPVYANPLLRLVALIIDGIILGVVMGIISFLLTQTMGQDAAKSIVSIAGLVLPLLYIIGTKYNTVGKKLMKIKVVRAADNTPLSIGRALGRFIGEIVDALAMGLLLLPCWMVLFSKTHRRFADLIAGTVVVKA